MEIAQCTNIFDTPFTGKKQIFTSYYKYQSFLLSEENSMFVGQKLKLHFKEFKKKKNK